MNEGRLSVYLYCNYLTKILCYICQMQIGYCPQFDALLEFLTAREHLELYARIKGVADYRMNDVCIYLKSLYIFVHVLLLLMPLNWDLLKISASVCLL